MIATLILMTFLTFPSLSIAMGTIESGMNPKAIGKAGEKGAFQVIQKHWGKVPKKITEQMKQHDKILLELLEEYGSIPTAVKRYNGSGKHAQRYLGLVTQKVLENELLGEMI